VGDSPRGEVRQSGKSTHGLLELLWLGYALPSIDRNYRISLNRQVFSTEFFNPVNNSLRHYRKKAKLTLKKLAEKAGVGTSTIGHVETGKLKASEDFWQKVSTVLGVSVELLMVSSPDESAQKSVTPYGQPRSEHQGKSHLMREEPPESNWERRARTAEAKLDAMEAAIHSLLKQFGK